MSGSLDNEERFIFKDRLADLVDRSKSAEFISCIFREQDGLEAEVTNFNVWSCLRFLLDDLPPAEQRFRFLSPRLIPTGSREGSHGLIVSRSLMSTEEAKVFLDFETAFIDPCAPGGENTVSNTGTWHGPTFLGHGDDIPLRQMLPLFKECAWVFERWGNGDDIRNRLNSGEWEVVTRSIKAILGVDLTRRSDRVANLVVVAPSIGIDIQVEFRREPPRMGVEIRSGSQHEARDFVFSLAEMSNGRRRYSKLYSVSSGLHVIDLDVNPSHYDLEVFDKQNGSLVYQESYHLMGRPTIEISTSGKAGKITVGNVVGEFQWDSFWGGGKTCETDASVISGGYG